MTHKFRQNFFLFLRVASSGHQKGLALYCLNDVLWQRQSATCRTHSLTAEIRSLMMDKASFELRMIDSNCSAGNFEISLSTFSQYFSLTAEFSQFGVLRLNIKVCQIIAHRKLIFDDKCQMKMVRYIMLIVIMNKTPGNTLAKLTMLIIAKDVVYPCIHVCFMLKVCIC